MYPNPSQNGAPIPLDYLNQISPQAPKKQVFRFDLTHIIIIGLILVVVVSILALILNSTGGGKKELLEQLSARLTATEIVVNDAQPKLKSSELRSLNSNLKIYMTNTNRDIIAPLSAAGISATKISKSVTAAESIDELSSRLEDARLNGVFDRTYAREMTYQLGTILTLLNQNYKNNNDPELRTFLKTSYDNLKTTQESFANFTSPS